MKARRARRKLARSLFRTTSDKVVASEDAAKFEDLRIPGHLPDRHASVDGERRPVIAGTGAAAADARDGAADLAGRQR